MDKYHLRVETIEEESERDECKNEGGRVRDGRQRERDTELGDNPAKKRKRRHIGDWGNTEQGDRNSTGTKETYGETVKRTERQEQEQGSRPDSFTEQDTKLEHRTRRRRGD